MRIVRPVAITSGDIVSTDATEATAAYNAGTTYAAGDEVLYQDFIYLSLQNSNTGNTPDTSPTFWQQIAPSNPWAMFDTTVSTRTQATAPFNVVVAITGIVNTMSVLNLDNVTSADIEIRDTSVSPAEVIYTKTVELENSIVLDWYDYFFEPFVLSTDFVLTDLLPYGSTEIDVTFNGTGTVGVGLFQVGANYRIGDTQQGVNIGIRDYSVKTTDDFGNTTFVERAFSKRMSPLVFMDNSRLNATFKVLSELRATPTVFIGTDEPGYEPLIIYGFLKDWNIAIEYPTASLVSIDIEGLI